MNGGVFPVKCAERQSRLERGNLVCTHWMRNVRRYAADSRSKSHMKKNGVWPGFGSPLVNLMVQLRVRGKVSQKQFS